MSFCVFQGTFNPIHKVHLKVAEFVLKNYYFDKIIFIPAYLPPHKEIDNSLAKHRYNMVKLAIEDNPKFEISDIEYKRGGNSYTYLTILELQKKYNTKEKINFIIGTDAFYKIKTWYETDKLKKLVHFIVFPRGEINRTILESLKNDGYDFELADMEYIDVSSSIIRKNILYNISIESIEIPKVSEYIKKYGLYKMA